MPELRTSCTLLASTAAEAGAASCPGIAIETQAGSDLDYGTSGNAHNRLLPTATTSSWSVANCDCSADTSCDLSGPVDAKRCQTTLTECTTNTDCPATVPCVSFFGPPRPVSIDASPVCLLTHFDGAASGSFDTASGALSLSGSLRLRMYFGISASQPCPRCGTAAQNPEVGDVFTCEGGVMNGAACTVHGVTPFFGGTSFDCAPSAGSNATGPGILVPLPDLGTGSTQRTAKFQCGNASFAGNPLVPATNPKCTDNLAGAVCTSNADCRRCTANPTIACTSNGDCTGNGSCAEAPLQPITCGFWCHCGFCSVDTTKPCFEDSECGNGQTCNKGTASGTTAAQQRPNSCTSDNSICGEVDDERCETTVSGSCATKPWVNCTSNTDCDSQAAGACNLADRSCFEPRITRSGSASPVGRYCALEDKSCNTNADCTDPGDHCVADSARPDLSALVCSPASSSSPTNTVIGITGPLALDLESFVRVCRCVGDEPGCEAICGGGGGECGDNVVDDGEDCDGGPCCLGDCSFAPTSTSCRASAGVCDLAESCSGSSASCPANSFAPSSTSCRAAGGVCDLSESCSGSSAACPADNFASSSTSCRASAGVCDVAESCSGTAATCPGDAFQASTVSCRAASGDCDQAETCSGSAAACPANASKPDGSDCDDGNACTTDECSEGVCEGTPIPECGAVCGNGTVEGSEACDDGNATFASGEYCGVGCVLIPCGKPTNSTGVPPKASDALFVLKAAVGQVTCSPRVCSVDGNQSVVASDALRVLRASVGQSVTLDCPQS